MLLRLLGALLIGFSIVFVPRNLHRHARGELPSRWAQRRGAVLLGWRLIIIAYLGAGLTLLTFSEAGLQVAAAFYGLAMLAFLLVPCKFTVFNHGIGRVLRAIFFILVALAMMALALRE